MSIRSIMNSAMKHVPAAAATKVGARSYYNVKASFEAAQSCAKDPTKCSCVEKIEHGPAKKLLQIFRNLPATKPIQYVEVLKNLGGKPAMDRLYQDLGLNDRSQMIQCAKAWRASQGRLKMAGEVLQVAMNQADKKYSLI